MASYNRIFSRPETLASISHERLIQLLAPHGKALTACGFTLPPNGKPIDYDQLSHVLMAPSDLPLVLPTDLIDALYVIADFSNNEALYLLIDALDRKSLKITRTHDQAPIDVAIDAWLLDKQCVLDAHLELYTQRPRSFKYLPCASDDRAASIPTAEAIQQIRPKLNLAYDKHHLALDPSITPYDRGDLFQFLVRRGDPLLRIVPFNKSSASSLINPQQFDLVVYDKRAGDLRMNVDAVWLTELYQECFGELLFGSATAFEQAEKFSLDVIRTDGAACLQCQDVPGIEWVKLVEIKRLALGGGFDVTKRPDVFAYYNSVGKPIPSGGKLVKAVFEMKFTDTKKTTRVTVYAPNRTSHHRDNHNVLIDKWLELRGFVVNDAQPTVREDVEGHEVLVGTGIAADVHDQLSRMGLPVGLGGSIDRPVATTNRPSRERDPIAGQTPRR